MDIKHALLVPNVSRIDAEVLLAYTLQTSKTFLYTYPEQTLTPAQEHAYHDLIAQRLLGVPIAYLTGSREFWSLPLNVNRHTLIPRPATERLVELALELLPNTPQIRILDLGTGSGAIALALASERPTWQIMACDKSTDALTVAKANAAQLNLTNIQWVESDWFNAINAQPFHAIVSNPPYIADQDLHLSQGDLRFEPQDALISGIDGLNALRHIIKQSYDYLLPEGLLLVEHGFDQAEAVLTLLNQSRFQNTKGWTDAEGHDRISGGWTHTFNERE